MEIFLDSANLEEVKNAVALGVISGVTTNPSLVAKEGGDFPRLVRDICHLVSGPVSAEVLSLEAPEMIKEARGLAGIHPNVVIKVPMTEQGLIAVNSLKKEGIRTNVTLVYSVNQAILAARAGASFVSPFIGRLDDIGFDGMSLVADIVRVFANYNFDTRIIAASIRHPRHTVEAAKLGAHIATVPYKVLQQMIAHPMTDSGIQKFMEDWNKKMK